MINATTDFQAHVWDATRQIPAGQVRTYGEIAAQVGSPGASRAVGNALMPLTFDDNDGVPFWRVVMADGRVNRADHEEQWPDEVARHRRTLVEEGVALLDDGRVANIAGRLIALPPLDPADRVTKVVAPARSGGSGSRRAKVLREPSPCGRRGHETVPQSTCPDCTPRR